MPVKFREGMEGRVHGSANDRPPSDNVARVGPDTETMSCYEMSKLRFLRTEGRQDGGATMRQRAKERFEETLRCAPPGARLVMGPYRFGIPMFRELARCERLPSREMGSELGPRTKYWWDRETTVKRCPEIIIFFVKHTPYLTPRKGIMNSRYHRKRM